MRFLFFLLFLIPAVSAGFCDDLSLEISACRRTDGLVSADIAPTSAAKELILVFQDGGQEVLFQEARGIRNREFDGVTWDDFGIYQRFSWPTQRNPLSLKIFHKDCIADEYRFTIKDCIQAQTCTTHQDCPSVSSCERGYCETIACDTCGVIRNHQCERKCADSSSCTQDICEQGSCRFERIMDCCEEQFDCDDGKVCSKESCDFASKKCERSPTVCAEGECIEPTGCLSLENQWDEQVVAKGFFQYHHYLSAHPWMSFTIFAVVLSIIMVLILVQTSTEFRRMEKRRKS